MSTIQENEPVMLVRDLPARSLKRGDVGAVVHVYADGQAVEVEFVSGDGKTLAVETLAIDAVQPLGQGYILHARALAA